MIELRSVITPDLVRLAVERDKGRIYSELRSVVDAMKAKIDDLDALQDLTDEFWEVLARRSGNVAYELVFNTIRDFRHRGRAPTRAPRRTTGGDRLLSRAPAYREYVPTHT